MLEVDSRETDSMDLGNMMVDNKVLDNNKVSSMGLVLELGHKPVVVVAKEHRQVQVQEPVGRLQPGMELEQALVDQLVLDKELEQGMALAQVDQLVPDKELAVE